MYRIALGYDLHRLKQSDESSFIMCGGVALPHNLIVDGAHSDGDVVLHALTDALLSVVGKDIGVEFPNTDSLNKNRSSIEFVEYAYSMIKNDYNIVNIDIVVICDAPKISSYSLTIRHNISQVLNISVNDVTIRGKTTENTRLLTIESYVNILFSKK